MQFLKHIAVGLLAFYACNTVAMEPAAPPIENQDQEKLLINALEEGNLDAIKQIFDKTSANVNMLLKIKNDSPPLMLAALNGHECVVRYLIKDKRAAVHLTNKHGRTALMAAAHAGHLNIVKYLLEEANPHNRLLTMVDKNGFSALHYAVEKGKSEVVKYFVEHTQFNPHIDGTIALSLANKNKQNDVVEYLTSKGVTPLPGEALRFKCPFYNEKANQLILGDSFLGDALQILAYTSWPIAATHTIPSLHNGATITMYQPRVFKQTNFEDPDIKDQLKMAVNTLGGTPELHAKTNPIFGGTCAYHAIKNALVGLMLLHDYDELVKACNNDNPSIAKIAQCVSMDIQNLMALKTNQFDCANFIEKIHAKTFSLQGDPQLGEKLEAVNIQQALDMEKMFNIRHITDNKLRTHIRNTGHESTNNVDNVISFINGDTMYSAQHGVPVPFYCGYEKVDNGETLYTNPNEKLGSIISRIQIFDLLQQIALFRTEKYYRHAFILSLNTGTYNGWGKSLGNDNRMHSIAITLDKQDGMINVGVFESNNIPTYAIKEIVFDLLNLFIDGQKFPMDDGQLKHLLQCASHPIGLWADKKGEGLPSLESMITLYTNLKKSGSKKREDVHKALFLLSEIKQINKKIAQVHNQINTGDFDPMIAMLHAHGLHEKNKLRQEEIDWHKIIQEIETQELNERMFTFVHQCDQKNLQETLHIGANPNARDSSGRTALTRAIYRGPQEPKQCKDIIKCLIENGAKVDEKGEDGQTPLMIAAELGNCDIMEYLMQQGAQVNAQDDNGCTPLMYAATCLGDGNKCLETIRLLAEKYKADPSLTNKAGQTVLMVHAIYPSMDIDVFKYLINECKLKIDLATLVQCIAHETVQWGNCQYGQYFSIPLLDYCIKEFNVTAKTHPAIVMNLAIAAIKKSRIDVIKRLRHSDCGFDINSQDTNGWNILMYTCDEYFNPDFLKLLIEEYKANIYLKNNDNQTAFDIAIRKGDPRLMSYFIKNCGFTIDSADHNEFTALLHAAARGASLTLSSLIENYHANINAKDSEGRTALMIIAGKHADGIKCEANECDPEESQSLFSFSSQSHLDIVKYLIDHGIDINAVDKQGRTALDYAIQAGRTEVIEYLTKAKKTG